MVADGPDDAAFDCELWLCCGVLRLWLQEVLLARLGWV